jgi:hypothetical protein
MEITHEGKQYRVVDDPPKDRDLVLTNNYGVWEFREKPDFLPYWCNPHTCKKMVLIVINPS